MCCQLSSHPLPGSWETNCVPRQGAKGTNAKKKGFGLQKGDLAGVKPM